MKGRLDQLRLARTSGVGPILYRKLMRRYGSAEAALDALPGLMRTGGRDGGIPARSDVEREIAAVRAAGARVLFLGEAGYPALLALMEDAPPAICVQGDVACLNLPAVALVGSRNASANGMTLADRLGEDLARQGLVVVSGLARGIDAAAHKGALRAGLTVACVAGGLDRPYPAENAALQQAIAERGCVVAEAPMGTSPQARHFPRRNRIIAGLSLGIVVVEAALRSGSLITARIAQEEGRELFAVPGSPLDARCHGSNALIRQGAHLVECAADIEANLPDHPGREGLQRDPLFARGAAPDGLREPQIALESHPETLRSLLALLSPTPTAVDDLVRRCQFSPPEVLAALLDLELQGRVETLPGSRVALLVQGP